MGMCVCYAHLGRTCWAAGLLGCWKKGMVKGRRRFLELGYVNVG